MSRSAFIALCVSVLILGGFALFSQNYRASVEQSANQAPVVASAAVPTDSPLDAPNVEASFVATPPSVQFRQPQHELLTDSRPTIYLAFDQPVDETSVVEALHVSPTTALDLKLTANTLYIQPISPLTAGRMYTFTLDSTATNRNGVALETPYRWQHLVPHRLLNEGVTALSNRREPFLLRFSSALQDRTLAQALTISPTLPITSQWNAQGDTLILTPTIAFSPQTTYTVHLPANLRDQHGVALNYPKSVAFTTPPLVVNAYPREELGLVLPFTSINVGVHPPIDRAATAASFQISPTVAGTVGWHENTLLFTPTLGYLSPETRYQLQVTPVLTDPTGVAITTAPVAWHFSTNAFTRWVDFGYGPKFQSVGATGEHIIQFESPFQIYGNQPVDIPRTTMALYPIDQPTLLAALTREQPYSKLYPLVATDVLTLTARWPLTLPQGNSNYAQPVLTTTLPATITPGLYVLNLESGYVNDQLLIALTDTTLMLKRSADELLAWVTDFSGQPLADQPVLLYNGAGQRLAAGRSDDRGRYRFDGLTTLTTTVAAAPITDPQAMLSADSLLVVVPSTLTQVGTVATDRWFTPDTPYLNRETVQLRRYTNHLYTDRPLYAPGQTVYFKGIIRRDEDAQLALPPADSAVTVALHDARNNLVNELALTTNALGTVNGEFRLATGAMLGDYSLVLQVDGIETRQPFQVEAYRKPDYQVEVTVNAPVVRAGAFATVSVASHYLTGQPVVNGWVTVRQYLVNPNSSMNGASSATPWLDTGQMLEGFTDATGHFTTSFTLGQDPYSTYDGGSLGLAVEATVNDASNQSVSNYTMIEYQSRTARLTLDPGLMPKLPGELFSFAVQATDPTGSPAAYQQLRLTVSPLVGDQARAPGIFGFDLRTDEQGKLRVPFLTNHRGYYQLQLSNYDNKGVPATLVDSYLLVNDPAQPWVEAPDGLLALRTDQPRYSPGDVAQVEILSSFGKWALLTVERGTVRRSQLVALTPPRTPITLPIETADTPNLFLTVQAWTPTKPTSTYWQSQPNHRLRVATTEVAVTPINKTLTVTISADQATYQPRTPATFQLLVSDARGAPVQAELSVALVDEAIYQLSADLTPTLFDTFYAPRPRQVATYDAMAAIRNLGGGRGGGGGEGFGRANPRRAFPDTAAWFPAITTDETGKATVTITLPDTLTSWRLVARAVNAATQVGESAFSFVTSQPLSLQPLLPAALTVGDIAVLSARIHNYTAATQTVSVSVTLSPTLLVNALTFADATTQQVTVAPGATRIVGWGAEAVAAGELQLLFSLTGTAGNDAIQVPLPLRPLAIPNLASQVGQLTGTVGVPITLPAKLHELSTVEVQLNRSLAGSMLEGLAYLTGYPYGCVEQTMSRALPNAVVGRLFAQLGVGDAALQAELPALIDASRQQLYGFQHDDGGWGWWYDDPSDAYQTAWVLFGLKVIREAGYVVDQGVLDRGSRWLSEQLPMLDARTKSFALYALAGISALPDKSIDALARWRLDLIENPEQQAALDSFSLAALAIAFAQAGDREHADALLEVLLASATHDAAKAYWPIDGDDGTYNAKTMASSVRGTALALSALTQIRPTHALIPAIVRWLMDQRQGNGWGTTNETAFTLLALTDYLRNTDELNTAATYQVEFNGKLVDEGILDPSNALATIKLDATMLQVGENALRISSRAGQPLYYRINTRSYQADAALSRAGTIQVYREYIDPVTRRPLTSTVAGQLVEVQLSVQVDNPAAYVLIEDHLPGGLEALNERLNHNAHRGFDPNRIMESPPYYSYSYKEVRSDRVSFFVNELNGGEWRTDYLARAVTTGTFVALPTEVYPMYDATVWGRSASSHFAVHSAHPVTE